MHVILFKHSAAFKQSGCDLFIEKLSLAPRFLTINKPSTSLKGFKQNAPYTVHVRMFGVQSISSAPWIEYCVRYVIRRDSLKDLQFKAKYVNIMYFISSFCVNASRLSHFLVISCICVVVLKGHGTCFNNKRNRITNDLVSANVVISNLHCPFRINN